MLSLQELVKRLDISCDGDFELQGLNTLKDANRSEISFLENKKYIDDLTSTQAGAVFVTSDMKDLVPSSCIPLVCEQPYLSLAKASRYFAPNVVEKEGNDPLVGKNTLVMQNVSIGKNSIIGDNCTVMAGVFIGDNVSIAENTILYPNVTVYRDCIIGKDCIIHAGSIIGSDGFGFAPTSDGKYIKIYQNGNVTIGDDVEIGANTTIDRAAFNSTIIEDGVRIDNLVQIAHNCIIRKGSIITAQCGIAGSSVLNEHVIVGAQTGVAGHLQIAPFTTIAAKSGVSKSIKEPKKQWAGFPLMEHRSWLKLQGKIQKLLKG